MSSRYDICDVHLHSDTDFFQSSFKTDVSNEEWLLIKALKQVRSCLFRCLPTTDNPIQQRLNIT